MVGALETVGDDKDLLVTYIRHLWSSMHGPTRAKDLYSAIRKVVRDESSAMRFTVELAENANIYAALVNSDHDNWSRYIPSVRKAIKILAEMQLEQVRPLLLAAIKHFSAAEIGKFVPSLVCWSVRFLVVGGGGGGVVEGHYAEAAQLIREGKIKTVKELTAKVIDIIPGDAAFETAFAVARVSQGYLARYYLRSLEAELSRSASRNEPQWLPNDNELQVNLEHIMPWSKARSWSHIPPDVAKEYTKRIGNLALLQAKPNSKAADSDFLTVKRPTLRASEFQLTKEAGKPKEWGPDQIKERQLRLAALAVKTWPLKS